MAISVDHKNPIALYSDPVSLTASGQLVTLDPYKMQNPANMPMMIDEIRFIPLSTNSVQFGAYVYAKLRVNRQRITADYVPIWLTSKNRNISNAPAFNANKATYIYRPPRPIYVPKYTNLQCELQIDPVAAANYHGEVACHFVVVYVGREWDPNVDPLPLQVDVPWVSKFIPPAFPQAALTAAVQSGADDLSAPFLEPLHATSMIGRVLFATSDAFYDYASIVDQIQLRMMNVNGGIIIRNKIPFGYIFDSITREFKLECTLDRQSYFIASIGADLRLINDDSGDAAQAGIALHGYRTVSIAEYMG